MQCFQLTCQCGRKAFPGGGGPRENFPHHQLDLMAGIKSQVGLTSRTEQVRLMVHTLPQRRQLSWGEGVVQSVRPRTCKWPGTLVAGEGSSPQVRCYIKTFKSTDKVFSFAQGSTRESIPVKHYIHRSAVHPRSISQGTQFWLCWEVLKFLPSHSGD